MNTPGDLIAGPNTGKGMESAPETCPESAEKPAGLVSRPGKSQRACRSQRNDQTWRQQPPQRIALSQAVAFFVFAKAPAKFAYLRAKARVIGTVIASRLHDA
jgi:hypothetical protein